MNDENSNNFIDANIIANLSFLANKIAYAKSLEELIFIVCNNTKIAINFHQAFIWTKDHLQTPHIIGASGTSNLDRNAPMLIFLEKLVKTNLNNKEAKTFHALNMNNFSEEIQNSWVEWLPETTIWYPLIEPNNKQLIGGLIFTKNVNFNNDETQLINILGDMIVLHMSIFLKDFFTKQNFIETLKTKIKNKKTLSTLSIGAIILMLFPIRQTVLAPAEIIAEDPVIITAPINETIKKFYVTPNQQVGEGQALFKFDTIALENNVKISTEEYEEAVEKLRIISQSNFENSNNNSRLSILKIEAEKAKIRMEYNQALLNKTIVAAPSKGVAIFSDEHDWLGKPVKIGEKILEIADIKNKRLKINLPTNDVIEIADNSKIKFYVNSNPFDISYAHLSYISYSAKIQADNSYTYTLKADFSPEEKQTAPRIGTKGLAKIYGNRVCIIYYVLRKPLAFIRQKLGI
jgi:hypothetical protein